MLTVVSRMEIPNEGRRRHCVYNASRKPKAGHVQMKANQKKRKGQSVTATKAAFPRPLRWRKYFTKLRRIF